MKVMKFRLLPLITVLPLFVGAAWLAGDEGKSATRADMRKAVVAAFNYDPQAKSAGVESGPTTVPLDGEVVTMAPVTVQESLRMSALHAAIEKQHAKTVAKQVRYGTGLRELKVGKVTLEAITILHIPVAVGISW